LMRSMYGKYPEYHTSLDNLDYISTESMIESLSLMMAIIEEIEKNNTYKAKFIGEPFFQSRKLYDFAENLKVEFRTILNVFQMCDGNYTLYEIAKYAQTDLNTTRFIIQKMIDEEIIKIYI